MPTDFPVSVGDVVDVTYTTQVSGYQQSFRANVTDTDDDYMNSGVGGGGFKCRRFTDNTEMGVSDSGWVCTFGWQQSFIGEDAEVEVVA